MKHFHNRRPLKYILNADWEYLTEIREVNFENDFIKIDDHGLVVVKEKFRSDGCSPKFKFFGLGLKGIPDGYIVDKPGSILDGYPITARAFFIHDALLDSHHDTGISARAIHREFCREIKQAKYWPKHLYCIVVKTLGPKH